MIIALALIAFVASGFALYFGLELYMMRLRATYWEQQVKRDSLIQYQWLTQAQAKVGANFDSAKVPSFATPPAVPVVRAA